MMTNTNDEKIEDNKMNNASDSIEDKELICGIVMPISSIEGLSAEHWSEVLSILEETILSAGFKPNLVSEADDSGVIQKRIIQNLYSNEIVVCDVSAKNPNVMFELGVRLAFDKPTIIIKDNHTNYSFDTSPIEHVSYPRDLRFNKIIEFKKILAHKVKSTYRKSQEDEEYSTFLKHFGEYKVTKLAEKSITSDKYVLETLDELTKEIRYLRRSQSNISTNVFIDLKKIALLEKIIDDYLIRENLSSIFHLSLNQIWEELTKDHQVRSLFKNDKELEENMIKLLNIRLHQHQTSGFDSSEFLSAD